MTKSQKRFLLTLAFVTVIGFALRAIVCCQIANSPEVLNPNPQTDMATYLRLARDIRNGNWPGHFDYQPFYYTLFLPLLLPSSGSVTPLILTQLFIGVAAVWLTGLCAAHIYGRTAGCFAALLLATARFHIFYTPFALYEVLQSFWTAALLLLVLLAWRHNLWRWWLASAIILCLAILTRGNAILFLPIIIVAAVIRNRAHKSHAIALAVAIAALSWLPQLPFAIVNYRATGRWTGASTAGDKVLVLGNSPEAPAAGLAYPLTYTRWVSQSDTGQRSAMSNILSWAMKSPLAFCELKFRNLLHFWDADEIPNNLNISYHGTPYSSLLGSKGLIGFGLFGSLALAGLFIPAPGRKRAPRRILVAFVLTFCAATVMFYMLARFRIAIVPLLCVLGAAPLAALISALRQWDELTQPLKQKTLIKIAVPIIFSAMIVNGALPLYRYGYEASAVALASPYGVCVAYADGSAIIHDHGAVPMGIGGCLPAFPEQMKLPVRIVKRFVIPKEHHAALAGKPFTARIMVFAPKSLSPNDYTSITITHNGQTHPSALHKRYAFSDWLEASFPALAVNGDGIAEIVFNFRQWRRHRRNCLQFSGKTGVSICCRSPQILQTDHIRPGRTGNSP